MFAILAVVPIIPALQALALLIPTLLLSAITAAASLAKPQVARKAVSFLWSQKLALTVALAGVLVSPWFLRSRGAVFQQGAITTSHREFDWPTARGDLQRLGCRPQAVGPTEGGVNWTFGRGESFYSSAAYDGQSIYIVGSRGDRGRIYCLDPVTGDLNWSCAPAGYRATFSSPVVAHDFLVCGEGLHHVRSGRVVCIDLRPGRIGRIAWTFRTSSHVECTPVIDSGRVYIGAGDDGIYCLELEPNLDGRPRVLWHASGDRYPDCETSLAVHEGRVYAGLGVGGANLCVLDADSGSEIARIEMPYPVFSPPSIMGDKLYLGMGWGDYVTPAENPRGQVCCIDLKSYEVEWVFKTAGTILGAVVPRDEQLYFGCSDGVLYCLSRQGKLFGKFDSRSPLNTSPAVTEKAVYTMSSAGTVHCLNRKTLRPIWDPIWDSTFADGGRFVSAPVIAKGRLFVGTEENGFACLGRTNDHASTSLWPSRLGGPGVAGSPIHTELPNDTSLIWQFAGAEQQTLPFQVTAPVSISGDQVLVSTTAGVASLDLSAADEAPQARWLAKSSLAVHMSPIVAGGSVLVIGGKEGEQDRALHCITLDDGSMQWRRAVDSLASGTICTDGDHVFVQDKKDQLCCLDLSNQMVWRQKNVGRIDFAPYVEDAVIVIASSDPPALTILDRGTGKRLWRVPLDATPRDAPCLRESSILLATSQGIERRELVDGTPMDHSPIIVGGVGGAVHFGSTQFTFISEAGELVVGNLNDPGSVTRIPGAIAGLNALVDENQILYPTQRGIMRWKRGDVEPHICLEAAAVKQLTTPLVAHGGQIFAGSDGRGLICLGEDRTE